jgi:hypothetical protein
MTIDKDALVARLTAKMEAATAARVAARIADAEREMRLRNQFADFWESVEVLNQRGLDALGGHLQFMNETWDPTESVITGSLDLRGLGGEQQVAYHVQGEALQIDWPGNAAGSYTAATLGEAIERLTDLAAEIFARPD